jgi:flagellar biogenesis protein FliO
MLQLVKVKTTERREAERRKIQPGGFAGWALEWVRTLGMVSGVRPRARRQMHLIETLALGGKKQLLLVACGADRFLVGTGPDSVQTIVRIQAEIGVARSPGARGFGEPL